MSKGLEALNRLRNDDCYCLEEFNECYDYIEKELKELEYLKETHAMYDGGVHKCLNLSADIIKKLTALDIIKNKIVDMSLLFETFNYYKNGLNGYNSMRTRGYELTQEEYDLLKEELTDV